MTRFRYAVIIWLGILWLLLATIGYKPKLQSTEEYVSESPYTISDFPDTLIRYDIFLNRIFNRVKFEQYQQHRNIGSDVTIPVTASGTFSPGRITPDPYEIYFNIPNDCLDRKGIIYSIVINDSLKIIVKKIR